MMESREQREGREMVRDWFRFEERDAAYASALSDAPSGPSRFEAELEAEPVGPSRKGGAENA
jgi:hypothetical protein